MDSRPRGPDPRDAEPDPLDAEGVPDLDDPAAGKAATGDPQEGIAPPATRPASLDYGTSAAEQRRGEPISVRTARELPDLDPGDETEGADRARQAAAEGRGTEGPLEDEAPSDQEEGGGVVLVDDAADPAGGALDDEADLVSDTEPDAPSVAAEEEAVHVVDEPPGAVDGPDSYL